MERAITVREIHAAVYPTDVEDNENGFWQRSLRALQDILPARICVDEQEQQEIMSMSAIEKEKYLLWVPLQTILLEAWENEERGDVTCLGDYTANEYDGEDWFPFDFFAANTQLSYSNLKRRGGAAVATDDDHRELLGLAEEVGGGGVDVEPLQISFRLWLFGVGGLPLLALEGRALQVRPQALEIFVVRDAVCTDHGAASLETQARAAKPLASLRRLGDHRPQLHEEAQAQRRSARRS